MADSPIIKEIFGKEGCIDLWKENTPDLLDRVADSSQLNEKVRECILYKSEKGLRIEKLSH